MKKTLFTCEFAILGIAMTSCSGSGSGPDSPPPPPIQETSAAWSQPPIPTGAIYIGPSLRADFPDHLGEGARAMDLTSGYLLFMNPSHGGEFIASVNQLGFAVTAVGILDPDYSYPEFQDINMAWRESGGPRFAAASRVHKDTIVFPIAPDFGMLDPDLSKPVDCKLFDSTLTHLYQVDGSGWCLGWFESEDSRDLVILSETGEVVHSSGGWRRYNGFKVHSLADGSLFLQGDFQGDQGPDGSYNRTLEFCRLSQDGNLTYTSAITGFRAPSHGGLAVITAGGTLSFAGMENGSNTVAFGSIDQLSGSVAMSAVSIPGPLLDPNRLHTHAFGSESPTFVFTWEVDSNGDPFDFTLPDYARADARCRALIVRPLVGETYFFEVGDSSSSTSFVGGLHPRGTFGSAADEIYWDCGAYPDAGFVGPTWNTGEVVAIGLLTGLDGSMVLAPRRDFSYSASVSGGHLLVKKPTALGWNGGYSSLYEFSFIQEGKPLWNQQIALPTNTSSPDHPRAVTLPNGNTGFSIGDDVHDGGVLVSVDPVSGIQSAVEMQDEFSTYVWQYPGSGGQGLSLGGRTFLLHSGNGSNPALQWDMVEVLVDGNCPEDCLAGTPWPWEDGGDTPPVYSNLQFTQLDPLASVPSPITVSSFELTTCRTGFQNVSRARTSTPFTSVPLCP